MSTEQDRHERVYQMQDRDENRLIKAICSPHINKGYMRSLQYLLYDIDCVHLMMVCKDLYFEEYSLTSLEYNAYNVHKQSFILHNLKNKRPVPIVKRILLESTYCSENEWYNYIISKCTHISCAPFPLSSSVKVINYAKNLVVINFHHQPTLSNQYLHLLINVLSENQALQTLSITKCYSYGELSESTWNEFCHVMCTHSSLINLNLHGNDLGSMNFFHISLADIFLDQAGLPECKIQKLDLSSNNLGGFDQESAAQRICHLLRVSTHLVALSLSHNHRLNMELITSSLQTNKNLKTLSLACCNFKRGGMIALSNMLKVNTSIVALEVSFWDYESSDDDIVELFSALNVNHTLEVLDVQDNSIGDAGALALVRALKVNRTLKFVNLGGIQMNANALISLAKSIYENRFTSRGISLYKVCYTHLDYSVVDAFRIHPNIKVEYSQYNNVLKVETHGEKELLRTVFLYGFWTSVRQIKI